MLFIGARRTPIDDTCPFLYMHVPLQACVSDQGARALVKLICNPTACRSLAIICVRLAQPELEVCATHTHHNHLLPLTHLPSYLLTYHKPSIQPLHLASHPDATPTLASGCTATDHPNPHHPQCSSPPTHPHAVCYASHNQFLSSTSTLTRSIIYATHHLLSCSPYPFRPPPPCRRRSGVPRWKGRRRDGRPWSCSASTPTTTTDG